MSRVYVFLADGFEEIEALTVVDILRRGGVDCQTVSVTGTGVVTSSHRVPVQADILFEDIKEAADMLVLPGGMPGTKHLEAHAPLCEMVKRYAAEGRWIAAVCAAPTVFGRLGLLADKRATCFPGMMDELVCKEKMTEPVVVDGRVITSRGMGTSILFGLEILKVLAGEDEAQRIGKAIVYL